MAIKIVFDDISDFLKVFNFFNILEEDGTDKIDEVEISTDPVRTVSLDDFADEKGVVDYDELPPHLQEEMMVEPSIDFEKVLTYGKYRYDINKCYFKTKNGRSGRILISGNEALQIIHMLQKGFTIKQIYNKMMNDECGFLHDKGTLKNTTTLSTIATFVRMYNKMELNNAIRFYCNNSRVNENPLEYVKFPNLTDEEVEVEDLWQ